MNIYVIVEGAVGEKRIYREWIPCVNSDLVFSPTIDKVKRNNFLIYHGGGYPQYLSKIQSAIHDVLTIMDEDGNNRLFDRLVVSADAEENSYDEKQSELIAFINKELKERKIKSFDYKIIVQNFCLEAWGLGNRKIISKSNKDAELKKHTKHFDVRCYDPELLKSPGNGSLTRAQYAKQYLKEALQNKYKNLTYTSSNPEALLNVKYYEQLKARLNETQHIRSFQDFLDAFK